jgi:DNA polymerase
MSGTPGGRAAAASAAGLERAGDAADVQPERDAPACRSWTALARRASVCGVCAELAATRTQVVVGVRPPGADVLLVGEAPGAAEDETGIPFVGRAGKLLDQILAEAGLDRARMAVANVLKCRPPGNRTPTVAEAARCRPWLDRQVELSDPLLVITLGGVAAAWALGRGVRLSASRGVIHRLGSRALIVTYHPSAALRFGPNGAPMAALREDLTSASALLPELRYARSD